MKKLKLITIYTSALILAFTFSNVSRAEGGLFVEPGVQYESEYTSFNWPAPYSREDGTLRGFGVGAKIGMHVFDILFAGIDATASRPRYSDNNIDVYATELNAGAIVGAQMPVVGLRVWGEFIFASQLDPDVKNGIDTKFSHGLGYKVGAGFQLFFVSLNLEYQDVTYTKEEINAPIAVISHDDLNRRGFNIGVSFPMAM